MRRKLAKVKEVCGPAEDVCGLSSRVDKTGFASRLSASRRIIPAVLR
jgi:hypothetical protein